MTKWSRDRGPAYSEKTALCEHCSDNVEVRLKDCLLDIWGNGSFDIDSEHLGFREVRLALRDIGRIEVWLA